MAPIVTLRLLGLGKFHEASACVCWLLLSWGCRRQQLSIFSLAFLILEGCAATCELGPPALDVLFVLQVVIAPVAWGGLIAASCFEKVSFAPMDRHLRRGLRHLLLSPGARRCLAHELLSHLVAQAAFAAVLWQRLGRAPELAALPSTLGTLGAYVLCLLAAATVVPPHELPYSMGALPVAMRRPLPLPAWLRGGGAAGSITLLRLPWWMQAESR